MIQIERRLNRAKHKYWAAVEGDNVKYFVNRLDQINNMLSGYERLLKERNKLEVQNKVLNEVNAGLRNEVTKLKLWHGKI